MPDLTPESVAEAVAVAARVEGWMPEPELDALVRLAAAVEAGHKIVEVGTYRGRSSVALALGARLGNGAAVYTFDPHLPFQGLLGGRFSEADQEAKFRNLLDTGVAAEVLASSIDSRIAAAGWPDADVGLLLVDGDHREDAVRADVAAWRPLLSEGATVVFDDAHQPGVDTVIRELLASSGLSPADRVGSLAIVRT